MDGLAGEQVVGLEKGLLEQAADVTTTDPVADVPAVALTLDQASEPQLRQVLAGHCRAATSRPGQGGHVHTAVADRPEQPHARRVRQQGEGLNGHGDLLVRGLVRVRRGCGPARGRRGVWTHASEVISIY